MREDYHPEKRYFTVFIVSNEWKFLLEFRFNLIINFLIWVTLKMCIKTDLDKSFFFFERRKYFSSPEQIDLVINIWICDCVLLNLFHIWRRFYFIEIGLSFFLVFILQLFFLLFFFKHNKVDILIIHPFVLMRKLKLKRRTMKRNFCRLLKDQRSQNIWSSSCGVALCFTENNVLGIWIDVYDKYPPIRIIEGSDTSY